MLQIRRINPGEGALYRRVRLAALADAPQAFCATLAEALERSPESWEEQANSAATGSDRTTFLALNNETPVGLAAIFRDKDHPDSGDLLQVWLAPPFRGRGHAERLLNALLDWASQNQFTKIKTEVLFTNQEALPFYHRLGFSESSQTEDSHRLEISCDSGS